MLTIKTDCEDVNWLKYILNEFKKINLANFDIRIVPLNESIPNTNVIYYLKKNKKKYLTIYNANMQKPSKEIEYINDDLFVLKNTKSDEYSINYDLFWNAFVFLSRYEEYLAEESGNKILSYSLNHPRTDKSSFHLPIVNILFNELEFFIKENFPSLNFEEKLEPVIDLSHDVDYINKTIQLRLKQTAFNGYNTVKSIFKPKLFSRNFIKMCKFAFTTPSYWCFEYWQNLEKSFSKRSTFYIYVKTGKKDFKSWLIDPSYDLQKNERLQKKIVELHNDGFGIGLHGSYYSANDIGRLRVEKEILEGILQSKVTKTRQHWLNYTETITPYNHESLFSYDSTLAWNDTIGFRSGCASLYNPYDFKHKKAFDYTVIPQVIMDSNIYDYSDDKTIFLTAKNMLKKAMFVSKTLNVSISWHQRVCSSDYNWHIFYKEILNDL